MFLIVPIGSGSSTPTTPVVVTPGVDMTGLDLVTQALLEIGVVSPGEAPEPGTAEYGLAKLNRLFDSLNADRRCVFASTLDAYTLTPSLQPHTIGPGGTFDIIQRPETLEGANLLIAGVRTPLRLRDAQWVNGVSVPAQTSSMPCDLYYETSWPLGKLWLYPIPSSAAELELLTRVTMAALTLTDYVSLPPGYRELIVLTLAESLVAPLRVPMPPGLPQMATKIRAQVFSVHDTTPRLATRDAGIPGGRGYFDYRTGRMR